MRMLLLNAQGPGVDGPAPGQMDNYLGRRPVPKERRKQGRVANRAAAGSGSLKRRGKGGVEMPSSWKLA